MKVPEILTRIAEKIDRAGGTPILVGGAVRDFLLGIKSKDLDVEVFGLPLEQLISILRKFGRISQVGKSFGVLKVAVEGEDFDFSLPRTERKTGAGHKGFQVQTDHTMSFAQAASRRDFTINAMGVNVLNGKVVDCFGGKSDLEDKLLKVVNPDTFVEDPLRVFRGLQFAARFDLDVPEVTFAVFRNLLDSLNELPKERIFDEIKKLLLKARKPSIGFEIADKAGIIMKLFPELHALHGVQQDPEWHPEGDVWVHTMLVLDEAAALRNGEESHDLALMLGALCHDFGKPETTEFTNGRWRSLKHTAQGQEPTRRFLERLTAETKLVETVVSLVRGHLQPTFLYGSKTVGNGAIRRLALKTDIPLLVEVAKADHFGRARSDARNRIFPAEAWLLERFKALELDQRHKVPPILMGRHLLVLGLEPGPQMGAILKEAYELQLDDKITSPVEAIAWVRKRML